MKMTIEISGDLTAIKRAFDLQGESVKEIMEDNLKQLKQHEKMENVSSSDNSISFYDAKRNVNTTIKFEE